MKHTDGTHFTGNHLGQREDEQDGVTYSGGNSQDGWYSHLQPNSSDPHESSSNLAAQMHNNIDWAFADAVRNRNGVESGAERTVETKAPRHTASPTNRPQRPRAK